MTAQWESYMSLSGLTLGEESINSDFVFSHETISIVQNLGLSSDEIKDVITCMFNYIHTFLLHMHGY